ncbi:MAG: DUF2752 domain-containing protein [Prolixibacteraceae bacterium]|jgi:hypothetical protein|nr:DUF2752 domain-containing protein [Prolixibacteraceae bacterium]MBT6763595.1 DUF2752 domain-containing protein [Prolixibacteraceae bacterium]MBT6998718.1 DUF2752 domain-containing protein [Prolixibacteraceae bacterium]MBT7395318.1 DUF2752 domain-containing protein [Prolixibacteraceae bacterium]
MKKILNIGLLLFFTGLAVLFFVLNPSENEIFPKCVFHSITGYYCPGCGSQRAIHSLLHLNFYSVVSNNFLFLPAVLVVMYHYLYSFINQRFNLKLPNIFYFKSTPWIILVVILIFWILRNLPIYPFSVLAPN